ncbi:MAG TPA: DNA polymerase III subunit epsilon [Xanthomonadales bacterium]|nr:DNA polymerase III subunit epsilon [Xanthomonadales bacterium]
MRQVVLDTETTGLAWDRGHRVIEIGCVELLARRASGRRFQRYLNPERDIDAGAQEVTGLSREFLADKPLFATVVDEFLEFIRDAELIIHNAEFDVGFLNAELSRLGPGYGRIQDYASVLDTLALARERFPGQRNSLDALCRRLDVDNSGRELHGALLDAQLLAEVYLALTAGQGDLALVVAEPETTSMAAIAMTSDPSRPRRLLKASPDECAAHEQRLDRIDRASGGSLWRRLFS